MIEQAKLLPLTDLALWTREGKVRWDYQGQSELYLCADGSYRCGDLFYLSFGDTKFERIILIISRCATTGILKDCSINYPETYVFIENGVPSVGLAGENKNLINLAKVVIEVRKKSLESNAGILQKTPDITWESDHKVIKVDKTGTPLPKYFIDSIRGEVEFKSPDNNELTEIIQKTKSGELNWIGALESPEKGLVTACGTYNFKDLLVVFGTDGISLYNAIQQQYWDRINLHIA